MVHYHTELQSLDNILCAKRSQKQVLMIPEDRNGIGWDSLIRDSKRYFSIITSEGIKLLHSKISAEAYFTSLPTEMTLTFDTRIAQPYRLKVFMSPIQSCNWCGNHLE